MVEFGGAPPFWLDEHSGRPYDADFYWMYEMATPPSRFNPGAGR